MNQYKIYRTLSFCLLINNLAGITLNFLLTIASVIFLGIGLPGIALLFFFGGWSLRPRQVNASHYTVASLFIIGYNIFICYMMYGLDMGKDHEPFVSFYPYLFPSINIVLSLLLVIASLTEQFRDESALVWPYRTRNIKPVPEPLKFILILLFSFSILAILCLILVPSISPSL